MKKLSKTVLVLLTLSIIASSCGTKQNGQLIGVSDRPSWSGINPYGMVYIPSGTLHIGPSDQDVSQTYIQRPKSISIQGFYMDDTEITNNEWRQFVYWVRDSLAHTALGNVMDDEETGEEKIDWEMEIDWEFLFTFTGIAILGIYIGSYLSNFVDGGKLKKGFGYFIFIMSLFIFYMEFLLN